MRLGKIRALFASVVLVAVVGCEVGTASDGIGGEDEAWAVITDDSAAAGPYIHYVSDTEMYARIGDKICKWDGVQWVPITDDAPEALGAYFHFVSEELIYAYVGQRICKWDGVAWTIVTDPDGPNLNLHPNSEFFFIQENSIYAFFGTQICHWDGVQWNPHTADALEIVPVGMHFVNPDTIYAVIGIQICKWDGLAGVAGEWQPLTADNADMKPDFAFGSETSIFAVIGQQVCEWDGGTWVPITEDAPVALSPHVRGQGDEFHVVGTDGMIYKSLPIE